jgi:hypothetical protein
MARAQHPLAIGQGLLEQGDRLIGPARVHIRGREIVP